MPGVPPIIQTVPQQTPIPFPQALPAPTQQPMAIDPDEDPILRLAQSSVAPDFFRAAIADAVRRNPELDSALAQRYQARAARAEASWNRFPVADLALTNFQTLSRDFSNDPGNVIERSRPDHRTDLQLNVQQSLWDFGAVENRIKAAHRRLDAATENIDDSASQVAIEAISAWYDVFGYGALVQLGEGFVDAQGVLREQIDERVAQGASAPGDVAQVESYIASANSQLAHYRRSLANARARFEQLTGQPAPEALGRAPILDAPTLTLDAAKAQAIRIPAVLVQKKLAEAARYDAKAARADQLPKVVGGINAGRYGLIETDRDYDVRANIALTMRIGGGGVQRANQAAARERVAQAQYDGTREKAVRDAAIAWSDVDALQQEVAALRANYISSRRSRDVLAERFRVSRGTLFDVLQSENNYFQVAGQYIVAVTQLDTARYVLLARTGGLLDTLDIAEAAGGMQ
ncbi:TolC family protein [Hephaestia sp. GCM10023244]|uniref:TolC family protein n=1 Tax=unclassified Hephaestia TaxID=2631281 RepID=UPI0020774C7A|nr:TolC family protein [Hephaestia sp. MAHUQ-44]